MTTATLGDFARGLLVGIVAHAGQFAGIVVVTFLFLLAAGAAGGMIAIYLLMVASTTQVVYMVPMIVRGVRRGDRAYVSGLCCAGLLLCVANVTYFVLEELRRPLP